MSIQAEIKKKKIEAMKNGDKDKRDALGLILASFTQYEVDTRKEITDSDCISILTKMKKMRNESITMYESANALSRAEQEKYELSVIEMFLPSMASEVEIDNIIDEAINVSDDKTVKGMGFIMNEIKKKLSGRADMGLVSRLVKERLVC